MKLGDRIRRWWSLPKTQQEISENDLDAREVAWGEFDRNFNPVDPRGSWLTREPAPPAEPRSEEPDPSTTQAYEVPPARPKLSSSPEHVGHRIDAPPVVADPEAVSLIAAHGGSLYVYADASGEKHVQTEAPSDPSIRFARIEADGFLMYVQEGIKHPETWSVTFSRIPYHHLDVAWEGHPEHPHLERTVCMVTGHDWGPDPDSNETYPVILCRRCGKRRELAEVLVDRAGVEGRFYGGLRPVRDR